MSNKPTHDAWEISPKRLMPAMTLRFLALVLILALVLLFPASQLLTLGNSSDATPSSVSIFYSRTMLQANPDNRELRFSLATKLAQVGEIEEARQLLAPLADDPTLGVQRLLLELDWQGYIALTEDDARRSQYHDDLSLRLQQVQAIPDLPLDTIASLAMYWLALGEPAQAAKLYEHLATQDPTNRYQWLSLAGQWWLKAGYPERSAKAWHGAFEAAEAQPQASLLHWFIPSALAQSDSRRDAALAALNAAQQSQGASALEYARRFITHYPSDPEFLNIGIRIALAQNQPLQALEWSHRYLEGRTDDLQALERHANIALAAGQPAEAASYFERLAEQDPDNRYHWLSLAGEWWLKAGDPERSAKAWRDAFDAVEAEAEPPDLGLIGWLIPSAHAAVDTSAASRRRNAALAALQAARQSLTPDTMTYVREYVEYYPQDTEILDVAIQIALALDEAEQAMTWSSNYLRLNPQESQAQERHVNIAFALGLVQEAATILTQLVEANPANVDYRQRLAQAQRWAGQPQAALKSYEYLATLNGDPYYDTQVIDIAQSLNDRQTTLTALVRIGNRQPLDDRQRRLLVDLYYDLGEPERAIAQIQEWIDSGPTTRDLWVRMATWQEQTGELEAALASWQRIANHFGNDVQETYARSRLQTKLWQLPEALATLQILEQPPASNDDTTQDYWNMLGELSWHMFDVESSSDAYQQLYRAGTLDEEYYPRLIQSMAESGNIEMAMQVVREDWQARRQPDTVIQMLDAAQRQQRTDMIHELFEMTRHDRARFADSADYWWIYAEQRLALHDIDGARQAYLKALALAPGNTGLRAALIYTLVQNQRDLELRRYLSQWGSSAPGDADLLAAFAAGYSQLGDSRQALHWYDLALRAAPDNYLLMLDYADALSRVRHHDSALRLRRHALLELRPRLQAELQDASQLSPERKREQARVIAVQTSLQGPDSSRDWLQAVMTHDTLGSEDSAWLFDSYMAQQQPAYARYWHLRAQWQRQSTPQWQQLAVAMQRNDHAALQRLLSSQAGGNLSTGDRIEALNRLGHREQALSLALDHSDEETGYLRRAAELTNEMPNRAGVQLETAQVGDIDIISSSTLLQFSDERLSTTLELGQRRLSDSGIYAEIDGLQDERFARLSLARRQRRGQTSVTLGALDTQAETAFQLSGQQEWQFTTRLGGSLFADYNALSEETDLLRALGVRDQLGATLDWRLTARDSARLSGAYTEFHSRESRNKLADGYRLEADLTHALISGATRQVLVRLLGSTEHNTLASQLPADVASRVPADTRMDALVPERYSFVGAGISLSRGEPGSPYPLVASPRYSLDLDAGYVMPDNQFGMNANLSIGTRLFGSDELSLHLGVNQSGDAARSNTFNAMLKYQFFLGR
ncbi:tetratricopeptide repeat protein [Vreelandella rituensis]|uniref:Tetratricopeptide repeat protein n=1 Tax=Vreelandella rituensis TaxID=2282306 RepID=A0A368U6A8_9GAMM|nr:tetratricopeptide repeat protein [Halomonas rituensis]RCV92504.1 hypothetical protein DU506_07285 [Halomonas rituensis]